MRWIEYITTYHGYRDQSENKIYVSIGQRSIHTEYSPNIPCLVKGSVTNACLYLYIYVDIKRDTTGGCFVPNDVTLTLFEALVKKKNIV